MTKILYCVIMFVLTFTKCQKSKEGKYVMEKSKLEGNVEIVMTKDGILIRNPKYKLVAREKSDK